jgi:ferredoxin-NADP reductase
MKMEVVYPDPAGGPVATGSARLRVRLTVIRFSARDINLYTFRHADGHALPPAEVGAHIDVHLPDGQTRAYSLVSCIEDGDAYVIAVKRDAGGRGGSRFVHDSLKVGDEIEIGLPRNNFPLCEEAAYSVLIAGGIGITPIWTMAQRLRAIGKPFELHYACASRAQAALLDELSRLDGARLHFDDAASGELLDLASIVAAAPPEAHLYCCGPAPMLRAFEAAAAGRSQDHVHVEYFAPPDDAPAPALDGGFHVALQRSGTRLFVEPGNTILDTLLDAGVAVPFSCAQGICGACAVGVVSGAPDHRDSVLTAEERATGQTILVCCSGSKSGELVLDL